MTTLATTLAALALGGALFVPSGDMATAQTGPTPRWYGVNLASAEFAPHKLPGIAGQDYIYPTRATAEPFRAMGMNSVRLPILWERIQPEAMGPLDPAELRRLETTLDELSGFDQVIVGIHNYGRYKGRPLARGKEGGAALADLWRRLAERIRTRPNVAFGLMNEPHGIPAAEWRAVAEEAVAAIRRTGATNLLLVPGTNWTGGHSWNQGGAASNAAAMRGFADPARNYVFEIHQYLDRDSSGSNAGCAGERIGRERLEEVTRWLRQERARAILGEFGVDRSGTCLAALDDLLSFLRENGDVWVGWNYWAAGDWWGDYALSIQPKDGKQAPQAAVLARHIASYSRR